MRNRHVLIIPSAYPCPYTPASGVFFQDQGRALAKRGFQVGVVYPDFRSLRTVDATAWRENHFQKTWSAEAGVNVLRLRGWNVPNARIRGLLSRKLCSSLVDQYMARFGKPDVIHAHCSLWGGVAAARVSQLHRIPFVLTEHSSTISALHLERPWQVPLVQQAVAASSRTICVSTPLAQAMARFAGGKELSVIPNVVDTDTFCLPAARRARSPFRFLAVAFLRPAKCIDLLLRAFARAFGGDGDVTLEIAGDGPLAESLAQLARTLGVAEQVKFLGQLTRSEVREAMWRSHVLVLPSRNETFGVVLIEAMATGMPVIATRCGGPEDIVDDSNGVLVPVGDIDALSGELKKMSVTWESYDPMELSRQAREKYGEDSIITRLTEIYDTVSA